MKSKYQSHMLQLRLSKIGFVLDVIGISNTGSPVSFIKRSLIPVNLVRSIEGKNGYCSINDELDFKFLIVPDNTLSHDSLIGRDGVKINCHDFFKIKRIELNLILDEIISVEYESTLNVQMKDDKVENIVKELFVTCYEQPKRFVVPVTNVEMKINLQPNHSYFFFRPR
ncbi:hypothetical protein FQA39_LY14753 [Lamprigera yunnana]|nr:hypothetical protein FQA39_LY14753 [Lamprigera yunnana]